MVGSLELAPSAAFTGYPYDGRSLVGFADRRVWTNIELLLFWVKDGPLGVPIITSSNGPDVGAVGAPSTYTIFGGDGIDYGNFPGMRFSSGVWLDTNRTFGLEGSVFFLMRKSAGYNTDSDATGDPLFAIPYFDPRTTGSPLAFGTIPPGGTIPGQGGLFITQPGTFSGGLVLQNYTRFWGAEVNGFTSWLRTCEWELRPLFGFRYLGLDEGLRLETQSNGLAGSGALAGSSFHTHDIIQARTQFFGAQMGLHAGWRRSCFTADIIGKLALGTAHEVVNRVGNSSVRNSAAPGLPNGNYVGGLIVLPSNFGRVSHDDFAVAPELQFQLGVFVLPFLRFSIGYDLLYLSSVVRPGDQYDSVINPTQVPSFGGFGLTGPGRPAPLFERKDFWAQGLNLNWEFSY